MLTIIAFSRNRTFQLKEYLRSVKKYLLGDQVRIFVIYKYDQYLDKLDQLIHDTPGVTFQKESNLLEDIKDILRDTPANSFVMFGVDDVFFFNPVDLVSCYQALGACFSYHLRLNENINFSFALNSVNRLPEAMYESTGGTIFYDHRRAFGEFDYPFELTSAIYKRRDIKPFIESLPLDAIHPNLIEGVGSSLINQFILKNSLSNICAYSRKPFLTIITTNVVQSIYPNRIHPSPVTLDIMNSWMNEELDDNWYRNQVFNMVHTKEIKLKGYLEGIYPIKISDKN